MSLMDALLEEEFDATIPLASKKEVWICLRKDGNPGSGTQSDPYNGSTLDSAPLSVASLTRPDPDASPLEGLVTTSGAHGYSPEDIVTISGVSGVGAPAW